MPSTLLLTCEEGVAHFRISFWHLLMKYNFDIYNVELFLQNKEKRL